MRFAIRPPFVHLSVCLPDFVSPLLPSGSLTVRPCGAHFPTVPVAPWVPLLAPLLAQPPASLIHQPVSCWASGSHHHVLAVDHPPHEGLWTTRPTSTRTRTPGKQGQDSPTGRELGRFSAVYADVPVGGGGGHPGGGRGRQGKGCAHALCRPARFSQQCTRPSRPRWHRWLQALLFQKEAQRGRNWTVEREGLGPGLQVLREDRTGAP